MAPNRLRVFSGGFIPAVLLFLHPCDSPAKDKGKVEFNRDIRPILSDHCLHCHGFDASTRKADLRLDTFEGATAVRDGRQAVKPGEVSASDLVRRITSSDPKIVMPPPETNKKLTPDQKVLLTRWIEQGGEYQKHWAFETPVRSEVPEVRDSKWPANDVDRFILATLESRALAPTAEASREMLIRRVTLDLTGLSPTPAEVDSFLKDNEPGAYERLVDRLLASPAYGEHMARYWLDVARYGDTHGLHLDNERSMWAYRDWVVEAFNSNLPFDDFTVWQLAGDLLPNATREQQIASGFNRCNVSTSEGGAIDEEFQVRYAVDRVETTSTAWMGLTMGCAVCHDHKLDPISQKEFFQVFSIFNNMAENAMDGNALLPPPILKLPTPEQEAELKALNSTIDENTRKLSDWAKKIEYTEPPALAAGAQAKTIEKIWFDDELPPNANPTTDGQGGELKWSTASEGKVYSGEKAVKRSGPGQHQVFFTKTDAPLTIKAKDQLFVHVYIDPQDPPKALMVQFHTDSWNHRANWGDPEAITYGKGSDPKPHQAGGVPEPGKWVRLAVEVGSVNLKEWDSVTGIAFSQFGGTVYWDQAGIVTVDDPSLDPALSLAAWERLEKRRGDKSPAPGEIRDLLKKEEAKREDADRQKIKDYYLGYVYARVPDESGLLKARESLQTARTRREAIDKDLPATMVSKELDKPRPAYVLIRGEYDKHGEPVGPGVPSVLPPLPESEKTNRLVFAQWLTATNHPLTARVVVNRFWQQFFGVGIVKTSEDFGAKGEWPSHPELLDWLATEFVRLDWDVKQFVRMLVTSATYRQDSKVTPQLLAVDPENRLLARGPRFRLDAEVLRDNALQVSGLLNSKAGGRGVRPYQPQGIWEAVGYTTSNTAKYSQDEGEALFRRSLYTFWKRTAPPPSMTTFDAPSREKCTVRRERTNTPLQALVTLNDPQFFEAARHFGHRMIREGGATEEDRLRFGFRVATARFPTTEEAATLTEVLDAYQGSYTQKTDDAAKLLDVGDTPVPKDVAAPELAAYTLVANLILNLDEVVTRN